MEESLFRACSQKSQDETWDVFSVKVGYAAGGEALRSAYKRERKKRKIVSKKPEKVLEVPRVICLDVETTPLVVYTFGIWEQNISPDSIIQDRILLAWAAKQLNDSNVDSDALASYEALKRDDSRIVKSLWEYLNGASIIIGHNIKDFDMRMINTRFLYYGLAPLQSYQTIDTLRVCRTVFNFTSNKLKFINEALGIKQKLENSGMRLWIDCMNGIENSLDEMREYCIGDVEAVEETYYKIRGYITGHPNLGLYTETENPVCPNCGSEEVFEQGYYYTSSGKFLSMRCMKCKSLSRKRDNIFSKEKKKNLLRN